MAGWLEKLLGRRADAPAAPAPTTPQDAASLVADGNRLLDAGRLADAAERYTSALEADPERLDAAVNLGFVKIELGDADAAVPVLEGVLARRPEQVDALFMLGSLALARGDASQAAERLGAALRAQPDFVAAHAPLVRAHVALEQQARAAEIAEAGLALAPRDPELHFLRANLKRVAGDAPGAIAAYRDALAAAPAMVEARVPLGTLLLESGDLAAARQAFEQGLAHRPRTADLCARLGDGLLAVGRADAACAAYRMALAHDPDDVHALLNLSHAEELQGHNEAARDSARRFTEVAPDRVDGWLNLGVALSRLDERAEADACFERARRVAPDDPRPLARLGVNALARGDIGAAREALDRAVALDPSSESAQSERLFMLGYVDEPEAYLDAARGYGRLVAAAAQPFRDWPAAHEAHDAQPPRLRVGAVSGDLGVHPVGYFVQSILPHLAERGIDLVAFPTSARDDAVTQRLRAQCAGWVPLVGTSDRAAAARIRDERIHVLLDLAGHSGHHRLPVFAWRPAPVQASWLGYWASTGVAEMDHLIADPLSVPPGEERHYVEPVWRLPETRLCFTPPGADAEFPVGALPAPASGTVTFGCYQNLNKVGDAVLGAWRRVLDAAPGSRLRLQAVQTRKHGESAVRARLVAAGFDPARLLLAPPTGRDSYLRSYAEVDLLLDTFPFPGGTTTCEALWMGVPTVSLAGRTMIASQGRLILATAGLGDWVADDVDGYVALAVAKARDLDALAALRARLRAQVLASPLFDARRFAEHLADALRGMWAARRTG